MNILSLPEKLLRQICSWLNDTDVCFMELSNKKTYYALSKHVEAPGRRLILQARSFSPDYCRWVRRRILRYSEIHCVYQVDTLVSPLLPSLLANCAPSAEFKLSLAPDQGEIFLAMSQGSIGFGSGPAISSLWTDLQHHLTGLRLELHPGKGNAQLGGLGMLTSLKNLTIGRWHHSERDLSGEEVVLMLPNLACLFVSGFQDGKLVLSCPRLDQAKFINTSSFQVTMVEDSGLKCLMLANCEEISFARDLRKSHFEKLNSLEVSGCTEAGRHIIQDVSRMQNLEWLHYRDFPAACVPESFPQSLRSITLSPLEAHCELPEGLKELTNLTELRFGSYNMSWDFTKPLAELLPLDNLKSVSLGSSSFVRKDNVSWQEFSCKVGAGQAEIEGCKSL